MLNFKIFQLNSEQQALIPVYRQKWQEIAVTNKKIDRSLASQAINGAYSFIELSPPDILFFPNPYTALEHIYQEVQDNWGTIEDSSLGFPAAGNLLDKLFGKMKTQIPGEILEQLQGNLDDGLAASIASETIMKFSETKLFSIIWANCGAEAFSHIENSHSNVEEINKSMFKNFFRLGFILNSYCFPPILQTYQEINKFFTGKEKLDENTAQIEIILSQIGSMLLTGFSNATGQGRYQLPYIEISSRFTNALVPEIMADYGYYIDYCHEVLDCDLDANKWQIFYDLITNCGWIFPYEKVAIVCDKN